MCLMDTHGAIKLIWHRRGCDPLQKATFVSFQHIESFSNSLKDIQTAKIEFNLFAIFDIMNIFWEMFIFSSSLHFCALSWPTDVAQQEDQYQQNDRFNSNLTILQNQTIMNIIYLSRGAIMSL